MANPVSHAERFSHTAVFLKAKLNGLLLANSIIDGASNTEQKSHAESGGYFLIEMRGLYGERSL